jgi:glycosyltransferase involved in cell wall biosynthesis
VLYINPFGLRTVSPADWRRVLRRLRLGLARQPVDSDQPLWVYAPLFYLPFPGSSWASWANGRLLRRTIVRWMKRGKVKHPIAWVGTPSFAVLEALIGVDTATMVYDCMDNFPLFHEERLQIIEAERQIASSADVVFTTAMELYERMRTSNRHTVLLPNAADYPHFSVAAAQLEIPDDLRSFHKPLIGYIGEVASWFDLDIVRQVALHRRDWTIIIIGPVHVGAAYSLRRFPNVHFLGVKPYADLPAYLSQFDVCLLPFKIDALTSSVNPIKLYEYLAAGKPVVSTPLREVLPFRGLVRIADRKSFPRAVESALDQSDESMTQERQELAMCNTWDQRIEQILAAIAKSGNR